MPTFKAYVQSYQKTLKKISGAKVVASYILSKSNNKTKIGLQVRYATFMAILIIFNLLKYKRWAVISSRVKDKVSARC